MRVKRYFDIKLVERFFAEPEVTNDKKYYIDFSDLKEYDSDIIMNAARILNMDKEVEAMKGLEDLHSIIDIDKLLLTEV